MRDGFSPGQGSGTSASGAAGSAERYFLLAWSREDLLALGGAVRELRARRYVSQERLADRAGMHRNHVGAIERGELNVGFRALVMLSRGLGATLSELAVMYERNRMRQLGILPPPPIGLRSDRAAAAGPSGVVDAGGPDSGSADPAPGGSPTRRAPLRSAEPPVPRRVPIDRSVMGRALS